jgi:hypothetical protein
MTNGAIRNRLSKCNHTENPKQTGPTTTEKMTELELFLLKEAQKKFKKQKQQIDDTFMQILAFVMFIIPLLMTVYLIIVGHFYVGHLPILNKICKPKPGKN